MQSKQLAGGKVCRLLMVFILIGFILSNHMQISKADYGRDRGAIIQSSLMAADARSAVALEQMIRKLAADSRYHLADDRRTMVYDPTAVNILAHHRGSALAVALVNAAMFSGVRIKFTFYEPEQPKVKSICADWENRVYTDLLSNGIVVNPGDYQEQKDITYKRSAKIYFPEQYVNGTLQFESNEAGLGGRKLVQPREIVFAHELTHAVIWSLGLDQKVSMSDNVRRMKGAVIISNYQEAAAIYISNQICMEMQYADDAGNISGWPADVSGLDGRGDPDIVYGSEKGSGSYGNFPATLFSKESIQCSCFIPFSYKLPQYLQMFYGEPHH